MTRIADDMSSIYEKMEDGPLKVRAPMDEPKAGPIVTDDAVVIVSPGMGYSSPPATPTPWLPGEPTRVVDDMPTAFLDKDAVFNPADWDGLIAKMNRSPWRVTPIDDAPNAFSRETMKFAQKMVAEYHYGMAPSASDDVILDAMVNAFCTGCLKRGMYMREIDGAISDIERDAMRDALRVMHEMRNPARTNIDGLPQWWFENKKG